MKRTTAYLSVFMSLTLTLVISLCLVFIEGVRHNTIRLEAECITDIGLNSVLAEYHRGIYERYNLFFIDSSYGTAYPTYIRTQNHLQNYIDKNLSLKGIEGIYMDPLALEASKMEITGVSLATDHGGYPLLQQAVLAAESDAGIGILDEMREWLRVVEEEKLFENRMEEEISLLEQQLSGLKGKKQLEDCSWIFVSPPNPVENITDVRKNGLINWVAERIVGLSSKTIDPTQYISARRIEGQMNEGNLSIGRKISFYEKLLLQEYLFRYVGNYTSVREGSQLDYQIEYLLFGEASDEVNLVKTAAALCGLRETANLSSLMADAQKREGISAVAALISATLLVPEAAPVMEGLIMIAWSCLESLQDVFTLLKGGRVPLIKDEGDWNISLESALEGRLGERNEEKEKGLTYEDYLRVYMFFCDQEKVIYRFMDIVEMDIRTMEGNQFFRIDGCIDYLEVAVTYEAAYGYQYTLKHAKGYR